jgi:hypothetical protein
MSHYIMIRRLRGPAILLLIGGVWLLHATGVINHPWSWFWPLLLILIGVFMLAERAALAAEGGYPPYPPGPCYGQPYPGAPDPRAATGVPPYPGQPEAYIPPQHQQTGTNSEGGKS